MIRVVEALRYRSLQYIRQEIGDFQILVGPSASGKSTFLDVIHFLGDILKNVPVRAVGHSRGQAGFEPLVISRLRYSCRVSAHI